MMNSLECLKRTRRKGESVKVQCWLDDKDTDIRNNNKLRISNAPEYPGYVNVAILDREGTTMENETVVNGLTLIKAVQNAMND